MTDLTVLVPVKNVDTSMFELALQSLIDQSMSKLRILVLCVGESHQVDSIVGQFRDDRIEIVQCEASDTIKEQLNRGISIAESEFIARDDADGASGCTCIRIDGQIQTRPHGHDQL